ncbi:hypothetical protein A3L11_06095 [Thermococcus siculi]|uniref:Probable membrane transporter protein n=1 Tax=Thermococcus siculi TaxID=72803 RepID=A0A2Z2MMG8_9EURY|nr:sulfite exporter TauE/SafE family protein [Thermococcus siculi]ASJ08815.1 hypothetical protein A3L11_06095 [Thermococcus siculi]
MEKVLLVSLALFAGFIGSLMSGGSIVIFFILTSLDLPIKVAIGTLKMVIAGLTLVSSIGYLRAGVLDPRLASFLTLSAVLGAYLGSLLVLGVPEWGARLLVAVFLVIGTYFTLRGEEKREPALGGRLWQFLIGIALGFYIGVLGHASTLVAISTLGLFFRLDILRANATAKLLIFVTNLVAFLSYASHGTVDYSLGALLLVPVAIGSWLGARTAVGLSPRALRAVFLVLVVITLLNVLTW